MSDIFKLFDGSISAGGASAVVEQNASSFSSVSSENDLITTLASGTNSVDLLVDYSDFSNFVTFNSAESYVTVTADQILNSYPIDGSANDLQTFLNSLDGYQRYFLASWPKSSGYLRFNPAVSSSYVRINDFGVQDSVARTSFVSPGTGSLSIQGWIDVPTLTGSSDVQVVFQKQLVGSTDAVTVFVSGSSLFFQVSSGSNTVSTSAPIPQSTGTFFAAVLDRTASSGSALLYIGSSGTYPYAVSSVSPGLGARFDLGSGSIFIGSGSVAGQVVRPFTGSIDSLTVWSSARSKADMSGTYNRKIFAQSGLLAAWRFSSAGPSTPSAQAAIVRDSSGHRLDGRIQNFFPAVLASGSYDFDVPDPILTLDDPTVVRYVVQAQSTGSLYDRNNPSLIFNMFPEAFSQGDPSSADVFKNFALILARNFDRIKIYVNQLPNLRRVSYDDFDQAPDELLEEAGRFLGWDLHGSFANVDALRYFIGRTIAAGPAGNADLGTKLEDIKAAFWRRTLQNLVYLYKTKGTAESVESLLRIYGADAGFVRLKEYARKTEARLPVQRVVAERSVYGLIFGGDPRATSVSSDSPPIVFVGTASIILGALVLSSTGNVPVSGSSRNTLGSLLLSSTGTIPITGSAARTFGSLVVASTGNLPISGNLAGNSGTFGSLVVAATGNLPISGNLGKTFGSLVVASTGNLPISGNLAGNSGTFDLLVVAATGNVPVSGNLAGNSGTFGSLSLSANGFPGAIGTLGSGTFGLLVVSATGNLPISGNLAGNSGTLGLLVLNSSGTVATSFTAISPVTGVLLS